MHRTWLVIALTEGFANRDKFMDRELHNNIGALVTVQLQTKQTYYGVNKPNTTTKTQHLQHLSAFFFFKEE